MTRVVLTDAAKQDLLDVWLYIAADSPDAADRWLDEIEETLHLIAGAPGLGRARGMLWGCWADRSPASLAAPFAATKLGIGACTSVSLGNRSQFASGSSATHS